MNAHIDNLELTTPSENSLATHVFGHYDHTKSKRQPIEIDGTSNTRVAEMLCESCTLVSQIRKKRNEWKKFIAIVRSLFNSKVCMRTSKEMY